MKYVESLHYILGVKCGEVDELIRQIGKRNYNILLKKGYIVQGILDPEVWKITEKGLGFCRSLLNRSWLQKLIDNIIFRFL